MGNVGVCPLSTRFVAHLLTSDPIPDALQPSPVTVYSREICHREVSKIGNRRCRKEYRWQENLLPLAHRMCLWRYLSPRHVALFRAATSFGRSRPSVLRFLLAAML